MNLLVLDPRISYDALKEKFNDDFTMLNQLEDSKAKLQAHFNAKYMSSPTSSRSAQLSSTPSSSMLSVTSDSTHATSQTNTSPQKNYTARFQRKRAAVDELSEFWNLKQEDFEKCNPVEWWYGRHAQFPDLYCLVHDLFSIPGMFLAFRFSRSHSQFVPSLGSAVAVERIFSGGRDTISLRHASLKPETIKVLMLVKHRLILRCEPHHC